MICYSGYLNTFNCDYQGFISHLLVWVVSHVDQVKCCVSWARFELKHVQLNSDLFTRVKASSSTYIKHSPVQRCRRIYTFLGLKKFSFVSENKDAVHMCRIPCELWCELIHERIWKRRGRLVDRGAQTHTLEDALLDCHLSLTWQTRRSAISVTGTRCPGLPGARTLTLTCTYTHTTCLKCGSDECPQLRTFPSGQIYVFRDIQVAVEDGTKASEWSLDILTNPFKLVVSCTLATFASSQNWLFHICKLSCQIGRWHGADRGCDGSHTETDLDWI